MMSDGSLSQEEIDALLQSGTDVIEGQEASNVSSAPDEGASHLASMVNAVIPEQKKLLSDIFNRESDIKLEASATTAFTLTPQQLGENPIQIERVLSDAYGSLVYLINESSALKIASFVMGQDELQINDVVINALQETFIQISEPLLLKIGENLDTAIDVKSTAAKQIALADVVKPNNPMTINTYQIIADGQEISFFELLDPALIATPASKQPQMVAQGVMEQGGDSPAPLMPSSPQNQSKTFQYNPTVRSVQYNDLGAHQNEQHIGNLGLLMDVSMNLTVELGKTKKQVREILQLGEGSIIELDKLAGEPVDVMVNHRLIAKGEVVVIDENFGVRITEIVSPVERITDLS